MILLDDQYFHITKQLEIAKPEITTVHEVRPGKYITGSKTGRIEILDFSKPDNQMSRVFFYNLRKITAIRFFQNNVSDPLIIAFRTDENNVFIWKSTDSHLSNMLNIDSRTIDVEKSHIVLPR